MKIRESVGNSLWNSSLGWCCEPLDPIPPGHMQGGLIVRGECMIEEAIKSAPDE